jgi:hypothetical protein
MSDVFQLPVIIGILSSAIRLATPYLYASIGEMFSQRSGVVNLGVDGIMLVGAYAAFFIALNTGNLWLAVVAAALVGLLMGLFMSLISVTLQAEQGISGIGLYMFGLGLSSLLFRVTIGTVKTVDGFPLANIPLLSEIPVLGEIFFQHSIMVYGAFLLVPLAWFVPGHQRRPRALCLRLPGVDAGGDCRRLTLRGAAQPVPGEPHCRPGLHCRCPGLLRRVASRRYPGWHSSLQFGERPAIVDAGPGREDPV